LSASLQVLFYRSGTKHPGLVGLAEVCKDPYPDHTSWDETAKGYDPKSTPENSRWHMVDIKASRLRLESCVSSCDPSIRGTQEESTLVSLSARHSYRAVQAQVWQLCQFGHAEAVQG
jgi:predicted RNA-binding protein with PUA-like domain